MLKMGGGVDYFFPGDSNNDGILDLSLLVWKAGGFRVYLAKLDWQAFNLVNYLNKLGYTQVNLDWNGELIMYRLRLNSLSPPQLLVLSFGALILLGTVLLSLPWATTGGTTDWLTSLFTATSAVCVTGLVVVDTGTHWSPLGQIIILLMIQIGGLGIMSFVTLFALLLRKRIQLRQRLIMQQALNQPSMEGIVRVFKYLLIFSFIIEGAGALILALNWAPSMGILNALWFGFFHSVSAFNNAGFDIFGNFSSLTGSTTDVITNFVISGLIITGGLGFVVLYEIYNFRKEKRLSLHSKIVIISTLILVIFGTVCFWAFEYNHAFRNLSGPGKLMAAFFQAVAPRTAGFNTVDLTTLYLPTQLIIMLFMFIGGSPGSTAGGIKTSTFFLLWTAIFSILRGKRDTEIFRRRIEQQEVSKALAITILALFLIFLMTILISLTHEAGFETILFEVVSAMGTVGLSLGLTTELNEIGKVLIIITMFLGRLGPITIGYALAFQRKQSDVRYPKGRIMIG